MRHNQEYLERNQIAQEVAIEDAQVRHREAVQLYESERQRQQDATRTLLSQTQKRFDDSKALETANNNLFAVVRERDDLKRKLAESETRNCELMNMRKRLRAIHRVFDDTAKQFQAQLMSSLSQ